MSDTAIAEARGAECEGAESCARRHTADGPAPGRHSAREEKMGRKRGDNERTSYWRRVNGTRGAKQESKLCGDARSHQRAAHPEG